MNQSEPPKNRSAGSGSLRVRCPTRTRPIRGTGRTHTPVKRSLASKQAWRVARRTIAGTRRVSGVLGNIRVRDR